MDRRRLAASLLLACATVGSQIAPAIAVEPSSPSAGPLTQRPGSELPPLHSGTPRRDDLASTATFPGDTGDLYFGRAVGGEYPNDLWRSDVDQVEHQETTGTVGQGDTEPAVSPGGKFVAFSRDQTSPVDDAGDDIFIMNIDGTGVRRVTNHPAGDSTPHWFPDGSRLVFTSDRSGATNFEIYSMTIDGTDLKRLTTSAGFDGDAVVSPDGTKIAFSSARTGDFEIYTMSINGGSVTRLTHTAEADYAPDWSPDGTKLAFTTLRTGDAEIFTMNADGSSETNRSNDPSYHDQRAVWSPVGSHLVFDGFTDDLDIDIWYMPWTGGVADALIYSFDADWDPDWGPTPAFPLVDAKFSPFEVDIVWVYEQGITSGCSPERYCPDDPVTRGQMASFLARALDLPSTATDFFTDDETSAHEVDINRVRAAGITAGCTATTYCPTADVTRGQMASFLARALDLPSTATDFFTDDETSAHEVDINRVAAAGITSGCTATTYCPTAHATRGQMAAFLHRALE